VVGTAGIGSSLMVLMYKVKQMQSSHGADESNSVNKHKPPDSSVSVEVRCHSNEVAPLH
jgi:hypothetical protein